MVCFENSMYGISMVKEIERKFLVKSKEFLSEREGKLFQQGYLSTDKNRTVRVRIIEDQGYLTIKGVTVGISRDEFEYEIPKADAEKLLLLCDKPLIEKRRYVVNHKGFTWEIDQFLGENSGLIIAEVELESENQNFEKPDWVGEEVSGDQRFYNSNLTKQPYRYWGKTQKIFKKN